MNDKLLQEIITELKGLRHESSATNDRLDGLQNEVVKTNQRLDITIKRLDGLHESIVVLQQGVGDVRYELRNIKDILSERVIWQNDTISIQTKEGTVIYGVINKLKDK